MTKRDRSEAARKRNEPLRLFQERMRREGRLKEFNNAAKALCESEGLGWKRAAYKTAVAWGYEASAERRIHQEWLESKTNEKLKRQIRAEKEEIMEERKAETVREFLKELPATVNKAREIDWASSHLAVADKLDNPDKARRVKLGDLTEPINGPCPSHRAYVLLLKAIANPEKFINDYVSEAKKAEEESAGQSGVIEDMGIEDIKRMLGDDLDDEDGAAGMPVKK